MMNNTTATIVRKLYAEALPDQKVFSTQQITLVRNHWRIEARFISLDMRGYHDTATGFIIRIPIDSGCPAMDFKITWEGRDYSVRDYSVRDPKYADMKYIRQYIHGTIYTLLASLDYQISRGA